MLCAIWYHLYNLKNVKNTYNIIKEETLAQVFSYEFCEISKNTFS